jgi:ABC-type branched-subunit amino acid transport system ATPase component
MMVGRRRETRVAVSRLQARRPDAVNGARPGADPVADAGAPTDMMSSSDSESPRMGELLTVEGLSVNFGGVLALSDVSFSVARGDFIGLIGPNGAGKTTVLNIISRFYRPSHGKITFDGADLLAQRAHEIIGLGISRTFQNLALCPSLSVRRNVMMGGFAKRRCAFSVEWLQLPAARAAATRLGEQADEAIALIGLESLSDAPVGTLSHGSKRKVELARALCAQPTLLMLDEPASGLTDEEMADLVALLTRLRRTLGLTIIVIEHHLDVVLALSDRLIVLDMGRVIAAGDPDRVTNDPAVLEAYLGSA